MNNLAKVLVIEDVNFSREALASMLTRLHCEVDSVAGGYEALEKVSNKHYDLIITDIKLKEMEGITLAETLRDQLAEPTPVIGLTSYGDDTLKAEALAAGMDDFLNKPLTFDSANLLLRKWIIRQC